MGVNQERSEVIILQVLELSLQNPLHPFPATNSRIGRGYRRRYGRCRRAILLCSARVKTRVNLASIPKSRPEIKNRCTQEGVNRENLASIPKFRPEIKNHCSTGANPREKLAAIPKLILSNQESLQAL